MLAAYLENHRVEMRETPRPEPAPGYALIRVLYAGICNTDLELQRGYYNFSGIPGHEFVGEVAQAEDPALVGRRVAGEINISCHRCATCAEGMHRHCPERMVLGIVKHPGAFAEYLTLPARNLHVIPDTVSDQQAVFIEPLAAARAVMDRARMEASAPVAVLGDGKLGLLIAQALQACGCEVHHYGRHVRKLAISQARGIETRIQIAGRQSPERAYQWVVEATGTAAGLAEAARMTRPRGTVVMKSTVHGLVALDTARVVVDELTLLGSRCGPFEPALELLARGAVSVTEMITEVLPLAEAPRAFERAAEKGALKVLLQA